MSYMHNKGGSGRRDVASDVDNTDGSVYQVKMYVKEN